MTDNCDADFSELDRDQLLDLANSMHEQIHEYADAELRQMQWITSLGWALDLFSEEMAQGNAFGKRRETLAEGAAQAYNMASLCFRATGVTRDEIAESLEFESIVDNFSVMSEEPDHPKD